MVRMKTVTVSRDLGVTGQPPRAGTQGPEQGRRGGREREQKAEGLPWPNALRPAERRAPPGGRECPQSGCLEQGLGHGDWRR